MDWVRDHIAALTLNEALAGFGIFLLSLAISFTMIVVVVVRIPENYFSTHYQSDFMPGSPWMVRWGAVVGKNLLGVFLILLGIVLSVPGVPGQGIITILLGLIMLDIPGKRPIEARIIQRPAILGSLNALRARFNKPPLVVD